MNDATHGGWIVDGFAFRIKSLRRGKLLAWGTARTEAEANRKAERACEGLRARGKRDFRTVVTPERVGVADEN
jgi:hypothetical protein